MSLAINCSDYIPFGCEGCPLCKEGKCALGLRGEETEDEPDRC